MEVVGYVGKYWQSQQSKGGQRQRSHKLGIERRRGRRRDRSRKKKEKGMREQRVRREERQTVTTPELMSTTSSL